jgi:hypothetical protein
VSVGSATAMMKRMRISPIAPIVVTTKMLKGRTMMAIIGATTKNAIRVTISRKAISKRANAIAVNCPLAL